MQIKLARGIPHNELVDKFAGREWKVFNREKGYAWKEVRHVLAAYENGEVAGYLSFKINGGAAYLSQIIVARSHRRRGLGRLLLRRFERFSKAKRCHVAYLETSELHREALSFYSKNGYRRVARLGDNKFHLDWYYMAKRLRQTRKG